jgi:hypothetical protein
VKRLRVSGLALFLSAVLLVPPAVMRAHEKQVVGALQLTIGWRDEPPFAGSINGIDIDVADGSGSPVNDSSAALSVEVSFEGQRLTVPASLVERQPGRFRAWIVPSRAGTYAFHISGHVKTETIDLTVACSPKTFPCVADPSEIEFPEKDPSSGQLSDRINQVQPRVQQALDDATDARMLAFGALGVAVAAIVTAVLLRGRRSRSSRGNGSVRAAR